MAALQVGADWVVVEAAAEEGLAVSGHMATATAVEPRAAEATEVAASMVEAERRESTCRAAAWAARAGVGTSDWAEGCVALVAMVVGTWSCSKGTRQMDQSPSSVAARSPSRRCTIATRLERRR